MGRYHRHRHGSTGLEQVDHLLVGEGGDGMAADLDKAAALTEARLPGVAKVLHLRDEAVVLHVEAELAQLVPPATQKCDKF